MTTRIEPVIALNTGGIALKIKVTLRHLKRRLNPKVNHKCKLRLNRNLRLLSKVGRFRVVKVFSRVVKRVKGQNLRQKAIELVKIVSRAKTHKIRIRATEIDLKDKIKIVKTDAEEIEKAGIIEIVTEIVKTASRGV